VVSVSSLSHAVCMVRPPRPIGIVTGGE
jgi:hypothetical protein